MSTVFKLHNVNNIPHIKCTCNSVFPVYFNKIKVSHYASTDMWVIATNCPNCLMHHFFYTPDDTFSDYFNILFETNTFNFNNHQEAVDYFVSYCKLNQVLDSS